MHFPCNGNYRIELPPLDDLSQGIEKERDAGHAAHESGGAQSECGKGMILIERIGHECEQHQRSSEQQHGFPERGRKLGGDERLDIGLAEIADRGKKQSGRHEIKQGRLQEWDRKEWKMIFEGKGETLSR